MVMFIVREDGYLTVNYSIRKRFYIGDQLKKFFKQFYRSVCKTKQSNFCSEHENLQNNAYWKNTI